VAANPRVVVPAVMIAAAAGVLLATARFGMGMTPDSVVYVVGARNLAEGRGYTHLDGGAIGSWPPGYSAILSFGERLGIDAVDFARPLSALAMVVTVGLAYVLLRRHVRSPGIRCAATIVVGCSAVLLEVYAKALSEHLFLPVVLAFVLVLEELQRRPADNRLLAAAIALAWAAFYLRYAGIVTIAVGAFVVVVAGWRRTPGAAIARAAVFTVVAGSLPALWMLRNDRAGLDPLGPRAEASATLPGNVRRVANELSQWVGTQLAPPAVRGAALGGLLLALGVLAVVVFRRRGRGLDGWQRLVPLALFVVVYVGYLVASASIVAFGAINTRFLLPVFVPTVVLGAWLFERVRDRIAAPRLRTVLTVVGVAWVVLNVGWFAGRAVNYAREGAGGYATERWHDSELMADVDRLDLGTPTYSNDARAINLFLEKPVAVSVAKTYFNSDTETGALPKFVRTVTCAGEAQLVWFRPNGASYLYTPDELTAHVQLEPVVERSDGTIYRVTPLTAGNGEC
jgi:hypothetical protein